MKITTVDEYIQSVPAELQLKVKELRETIKQAAPKADEIMAYNMPGYIYNKPVVYFCLWKEFISIYAISGEVQRKYADDLKDKIFHKGTIQFSLSETVPLELIKKLVQAQYKLNETYE